MTKELIFEHPPRDHVAILGYDSDNDRFQVAYVDSSGNLQVGFASGTSIAANMKAWDGDSWENVQIDASGHLQVDVAAAVNLNTQLHGQYDGSWQALQMLWGFHDVAGEELSDLSLDAGSNTLSGTAVPSDEVHVITTVSTLTDDGGATRVRPYILRNSDVLVIADHAPPTNGTYDIVTGQWILGPGDQLKCLIAGATAGKYLYCQYTGYMMKLDL